MQDQQLTNRLSQFGFQAGTIEGLVAELARLIAPRYVPLRVWRDEVLLAYQTRHRNTRIKMRQALRELIALAPDDGTTEQVSPSLIDEFAARRGRASTVNGLLASIHAAVRLGIRRKYFRAELLEQCQWRIARYDPPRIRHHSREDVSRLLEELSRRAHDWEGRRLEVLGNVLAYCGLRPGEAYRLRVEDVDLERGFVFVRPNGHRLKTKASEAPVPICEELAPLLADWIPRVGSEWLVPKLDRQGPWIHGKHGGRPGDRLASVALQLGIKGLTPRSLRHSLATHMLGYWGLTPSQVKLLLRHTTEQTQVYYVHPDLVNLRALVSGFSYRASAGSDVVRNR